MSALTKLTLKAALDGLESKAFSSEEITQAHIAAIEAARSLNAYVLETPDKALQMARASDARRASPGSRTVFRRPSVRGADSVPTFRGRPCS